MNYPGPTGTIYSHFNTTVPNLKWFTYNLSITPTTSRTLTGAAATDYVVGATGFRVYSSSSVKKMTIATIATSLGTNLIKFSNAVSNMIVFGAWLDRDA